MPELLILVLAAEAEAHAVVRLLGDDGWNAQARRVDDLSGFQSAIEGSPFDAIVCDYVAADVSGLEALRLLRSSDPCVPFVFISDVPGEAVAVESIRAGADGYVPKDELQRIGRVVERAIHDGRLRRARLDAEQGLRDNEQRLRAMIESAVDAVVAIDERGTIKSFNPAAEALFNYRPEDVLGRNVSILMPEPYHSEHDQYLRRYLTTGERRIIGTGREVAARLRDGQMVPVELSISEAIVNGQKIFTGFMRDVSGRKRLEAALRQQALHDPLTGLPNRRLFLDRLSHALARSERHPSPVAVLFMDLDRFKIINDTLGHGVGDEVLKETARRLVDKLRPADTVARFGGDEFVILCEDVSGQQEALEIAGRLESALQGPILAGDSEVFISASVGIAVGHHHDAQALLRNADTAMYRAKELGRGRNELYDDEMLAQARQRLETERALHRALERGEFLLHYQPEVSVSSGEPIGMEALLRWNHPERGLLAPDQFLEVAEETGLIVPIGSWVLREACRQAAEWRAARLEVVKIWVNVSARELANPSFLDTVAEALASNDCANGTVGIELTEGALMLDAEEATRVTHTLKNLGVSLSIDDFGTGYSSLSYLKRFPVESLKIDRSFVDGLAQDEDDRSIVTAIISLASSLRLSVIAEGVETQDQVAVLRDLGCDAAQGYFLARPAPADEAGDFLAHR